MLSNIFEVLFSIVLVLLGLFIISFTLPYKSKESNLTPSEKYQSRYRINDKFNTTFLALLGILLIGSGIYLVITVL